jgi:hypothetical protein
VQESVSSGLSFRHADGTNYGGPSWEPQRFERFADLDFGPRETRGALSHVATHVGADAGLEAIAQHRRFGAAS